MLNCSSWNRWLWMALLFSNLIYLSSCKSTASDLSAEDRNYLEMQLWVDWYLPSGDYTGLIDLKGSPGFNPKNKTIIHFNGWSIGRGEKGRYFKTNYVKDGAPDRDITDFWLEKNWNFAVVDWTQFSDEKDLRNAEAKIWTTEGPTKNRWMDANGHWSEGPEKSISVLVADRLEPQLAALENDDIIFMGHSFGTQLAIAVANELEIRRIKNPKIKTPKEIVLSDPVFTSGKKSYFGNRRSIELASDATKNLYEKGTALTLYKCSALSYQTFFVDDVYLLADAGVLTIESDYKDVSIFELDKRHKACKWKYLLSIEQNSALVDGQEQAVGIAIQDRSLVRSLAKKKVRLKLVDQDNGRPIYSQVKK